MQAGDGQGRRARPRVGNSELHSLIQRHWYISLAYSLTL